MGIVLSKLNKCLSVKLYSGFAPYKILLLGLDGAGKTTVLYKIKLKQTVEPEPTLGFNVENVEPVKRMPLTVWDIGGHKKIRPLWRHHYLNTAGIIFVMDSSDRDLLEDANEALKNVLTSLELKHVPIVALANKQDIPGAMRLSEVEEGFDLHQISDRKWAIKGISAVTGEGLRESMKVMVDLIRRHNT